MYYMFFFLILTSSLSAAGPIMHAYLTEKWIENQESYDEAQKKQMLVGSLFPDIRYLGGISREETHYPNIQLHDLLDTSSPFEKGKKFHSYVDSIRSNLVIASGIQNYFPDVPREHFHTFLKLIEDEILFDDTDSFFAIDALDSIYDEEVRVVSHEHAQNWHAKLQNYFSLRPCQLLDTLAKYNLSLFNIPKATIKIWAKLVPAYSQDPFLIDYTHHLTNNIINSYTNE